MLLLRTLPSFVVSGYLPEGLRSNLYSWAGLNTLSPISQWRRQFGTGIGSNVKILSSIITIEDLQEDAYFAKFVLEEKHIKRPKPARKFTVDTLTFPGCDYCPVDAARRLT